MKIYAHRGYSGSYPENTLAAFRAVTKLPVHGVEFDVHLTKDRQVVVIHDESINRTSNGKGYIKDMTLKELRSYDFGSWFGREFAGEVIPTLSEVLNVFHQSHHHINIELKSDIFVYTGLEDLVLKEVEECGMLERVVISSFDHEAVKRVFELAPDVENAALFANMILNVKEYQTQLPAKALHVYLPTVVRKPVLDAIKQGSIVRVWTVNELDYVDQLLRLGIDGIFTDEPEKMYEYIYNRQKKSWS
ncbi:glycerophosphodiester phosphodiesterase [Butyricicoccus sp. 1XD8-22]|nr:glycerophosphodiester phosphodiesterase [Butyricicoccus sp. 1XD8-22]